MKRYWEIIADKLSKAGWSWGCISAIDSNGRTILVADAHRGDGELATLSAGAWPFADFGPIAEIQSAATAEIEITKRKRFLTRATSLR